MGKIEDLQQELYAKEGDEVVAKRMHRRVFFPERMRSPEAHWSEDEDVRAPTKKNKSLGAGQLILIGLGVFLLIGAVVAAIFYFIPRGVGVEITIRDNGPVESGEVVTIPISIRNTSSVALENADLSVVVPPSALVKENGLEISAPPRILRHIGTIRAGEEVVVDITVRLFGAEGDEETIEVDVLYQPENLKARFSAKQKKKFIIGRVPIAIFLEFPDTLAKGQETEIIVRYSSQARDTFPAMAVMVDYPPGFTFLSAEPAPLVESRIWDVGRVDPGKEGVIKIHGTVSGNDAETKAFGAHIGTYNIVTKEWKQYAQVAREAHIAVTPLAVHSALTQVHEGSIKPGDPLSFAVSYQNNTPFALKNISLQVEVNEVASLATGVTLAGGEPSVLIPISLQIGDGGVVDGTTHLVRWTPAGTDALRELASEASGVVHFSVNTRARPAVRSDRDQNISVRVRAKITAAGVPQELAGTDLDSEETTDFKVRSLLLTAGQSRWGAAPFVNTGPLPPRVGHKTTYAVLWEIRNFTNDLQEVMVEGTLPPNVRWENTTAPSSARVSYDGASGLVRWSPGIIPAGTGILNPALSLAFQVSVTPADIEVGRVLDLVKNIRVRGKDAFTGDAVESVIQTVTTSVVDVQTTGVRLDTVAP
ncbi:MAG: hypothetical protein Q8Q94_01070 [bacterium]|nr:hypothetical protein [bacterium]MDZ4299343.1 hypothetical protein [Candidatus Sungbacteria bacterium]